MSLDVPESFPEPHIHDRQRYHSIAECIAVDHQPQLNRSSFAFALYDPQMCADWFHYVHSTSTDTYVPRETIYRSLLESRIQYYDMDMVVACSTLFPGLIATLVPSLCSLGIFCHNSSPPRTTAPRDLIFASSFGCLLSGSNNLHS